MRDPNRLDKYYKQLCELHKQYFPDWRMGQFMSNFLSWHQQNYGDPFFPEDAQFSKRIKEFCEEILNITL